MITPIEIQKTEFKPSSHGYSKKEVDDFKSIILTDYETLYRQNLDLNDKINAMSEKIAYYMNLEKSLHKALVLAEKSADETKKAAQIEAQSVIREAHVQALAILEEARTELFEIKNSCNNLVQQYELYRLQVIAASEAQIKLLKSDTFKLDRAGLDQYDKLLQDIEDKSNEIIKAKLNAESDETDKE